MLWGNYVRYMGGNTTQKRFTFTGTGRMVQCLILSPFHKVLPQRVPKTMTDEQKEILKTALENDIPIVVFDNNEGIDLEIVSVDIEDGVATIFTDQ